MQMTGRSSPISRKPNAAPIAAGTVLDLVQGTAGWGLAFSLNGTLAVVGVSTMFALRRMPESLRMAHGKR